MRKPFNKVSILLVLALVGLLCVDAKIGWIKYQEFLNGVEGLRPVLETAASAIWQAACLAGLAAFIEIVDRIRWQLKDRGAA
jgi:hypothetical protein